MTGIVLVGLNGSGKSTLGKALANSLNLELLEIEDFWFETQFDYDNPRPVSEVSDMIMSAIQRSKHGFVITGNIINLSQEILQFVTHIFYLKAPVDIRMSRIEQREIDYWGELSSRNPRYQEQQNFREFARTRTPELLENWLRTVNLPTIELDGQISIQENVEIIKDIISSYHLN